MRHPAFSPSGSKRMADRLLDLGIYGALLGLIAYFWAASPYFMTTSNLLNIGNAVAISGIMAAGMTVVLICGQLDLSVGAIQGFVVVTVVVASVHHGLPVAVAIPLGVVAGIGCGLLNGILVVVFGINSIIATLASASVIRGTAYVLTSGTTIPFNNAWLLNLVESRPLGVPMPVYVLAVVYLLGFVLLRYLKFGWHVYATGGSSSAATRAGIPVRRIYYTVFLISALCASIAGLITIGQTASGSATYGTGVELSVLTAVLLGGIGLSGGVGRIERTLVGVLIIGVLSNGLVLTSVQSFYQQIANGIVFLLAVIAEATRMKRRTR